MGPAAPALDVEPVCERRVSTSWMAARRTGSRPGHDAAACSYGAKSDGSRGPEATVTLASGAGATSGTTTGAADARDIATPPTTTTTDATAPTSRRHRGTGAST